MSCNKHEIDPETRCLSYFPSNQTKINVIHTSTSEPIFLCVILIVKTIKTLVFISDGTITVLCHSGQYWAVGS